MIEAIKNGKKVRRECWSGDKFLYYVGFITGFITYYWIHK